MPTTVTVEAISDAAEGGTDGVFRFTRTGGTSGNLTVNYTVGGTATGMDDYTAIDSPVTFPFGEATLDVPVAALIDEIYDPGETVVVTVTTGADDYVPGTEDEATVVILDRPLVSIERINDAVEGGTDGVFRFTRTGDTSGSLVVNYTIEGSADPEDDYSELSGTATFAANEDTVDVVVAAVDDSAAESDETVYLAITNDADYVADSQELVGLVIVDNESPVITVTNLYDACEGNWHGAISFARTGNTSQTLTVQYA